VRYTQRELILAAVAGVLAVVAAVFLILYLVPGPSRTARVISPLSGTRSAHPATGAPASAGPRALAVGYLVGGRWKGGFNAELTVTNLSSQPVEGWTVRLEMPANVAVGSAWSADVKQVANTVTLRSQPWNTYLAPGAAMRIGFEAKGDAAAPQSCTVNDAPC
jgi:cellulase/cellobiase CelA1